MSYSHRIKFVIALAMISAVVLTTGCSRARRVKIRGQVVDDRTGKPVVDAKLCLRTYFHNLKMQADGGYRKNKTGPDGRFEFSGLKLKDSLVTVYSSNVELFVVKAGYYGAETRLDYFSNFRKDFEIRLEPERAVPLPQGKLLFDSSPMGKVEELDEPTFRFVLKEEMLVFAAEDQPADFEVHYKFGPVDPNDNMFPTTSRSKSGKQQYLESVSAAPNRIAQLQYQHAIGHPLRLPDLSKVKLRNSLSFVGSSRWQFGRENEFLLKTLDGNYALLHFGIDLVQWVYQPDGSLDISRPRYIEHRYNSCCGG